MALDDSFNAHFPTEISQDTIDWVRGNVFQHSRYVVVRKNKKAQIGFCTHCKYEYEIKSDKPLKHNEKWTCQHCDSPVVIKSEGRGRKNLFIRAYLVWYDKSSIHSDAIVATGFHVHQDFQDYRQTEPTFRPVGKYLFMPGHSEMRYHDWYSDKWHKPKKIRSLAVTSMQHIPGFVAIDSIEVAVKGTSFQYSTWERYSSIYSREDHVHFFELASKYPCIEYLTKLGFSECVKAKLIGNRTHGVINWRGKTFEKVVKLSKTELKDLKRSKVVVDPDILCVYHAHKKRGLKLTFTEAYLLGGHYYIEEALKLPYPLVDLTKYVLKQFRKDKGSYYSADNVLRDLRDYWGDAEELGLDLAKDHVRFPNNLHRTHMDVSKRIKVKVDKKLNQKITKRLSDLSSLNFSRYGLHIRPAQSSIELFEEGKALNHCISRYAERYANGITDIYFIRKDSAPDQPFYTVEIINGRVIQCRGRNNGVATKEVEAFIEVFKLERLINHQKKLAV